MGKRTLVRELVDFLRENKKLWLLPVALTLILLGGLLVVAETSSLGPLLYTVF